MLTFGSVAAWITNPVISVLIIFAAIYLFIKFCTWSKQFQLPAAFRKWIFILTGVGMIVFNVMYAKGNTLIAASGDWSGATIALITSLIWVFLFTFALMAENKPE